MRIAIETITDAANYGNRLQNYALQKIMEKMKCEAFTIKNITPHDQEGISKIKELTKDLLRFVLGRPHYLYYRKRKRLFANFNKEYIHFSKMRLGHNKIIHKSSETFDLIVCGSDQIWNTNFKLVQDNLINYLGGFAKNAKRISYAASFGSDRINEQYHELFVHELLEFSAISVREKSGAKIIKELIDKKVPIVLDPTMLVLPSDWNKIARKPKYIKSKKYIVTYIMSEKNPKLRKYIDKVSAEYNVDEVINLDVEFILSNSIEDTSHYCTAPDEFVWLIANAECVITDSFHATVFSIIFNKSFIVFERQTINESGKMNNRIITLLDSMKIEGHRDDINNPSIMPYNFDYNKSLIELERKRNESLLFLQEAIMADKRREN